MYLIVDRRLGMEHYIFTYDDPKEDGYEGEVNSGVTLTYAMNDIHLWPDGTYRPDPKLGRDPANPKHFQVFKYPADLEKAGFEYVHFNTPIVVASWNDYRQKYYPVPEQFAKTMTQSEWFDYLEETDQAARIRKTRDESKTPPKESSSRDFAHWIAKTHMKEDSSIQEVWFLEKDSPQKEIRLLEVNEQLGEVPFPLDPVDFGVGFDGVKLKLIIADITPAQLSLIKNDPKKYLPEGWVLDGALIWGRRGKVQ